MAEEAPWRCGPHAIELGRRTLVMGIVNVTPDSFSDGGAYRSVDDAVKHALRMASDGADLLDVGGESTRPGSDRVPAAEEIARVVPVIQRIARERPDTPVSVDTRKAEVARAGLEAGAAIVNDISAGVDPAMFELVREASAGLVLMHMKGEPKTMQDDPTYHDVVAEVRGFLGERIEAAVGAGIDRASLCVDPGIGFGKTLEHNLAILREIAGFHQLGTALMVGPSRKRFIGTLTQTEVGERIEGTAGAVAWCAGCGVDVVRVHDVKEMTRVVRVVDAIARATT
ncbi:MAG: dihydropteroate synthase [Actinomycetota bacterium]